MHSVLSSATAAMTEFFLNPSKESKVVIGVDVGSTSVRALVVDSATGEMLASATEPLDIRHPKPGWAEQSSQQIWTATRAAVKSAVQWAAIDVDQVVGIGFGATCSLVVLDYAGIIHFLALFRTKSGNNF